INGSANTLTGSPATVTVTLYISSTQIHDGSAMAPVPPVTRHFRKLKPGKGFNVHFPGFVYPTAGSVFLVADAALNGALDSTDGATGPITVAAPFVDTTGLAVKPTKTTVVPGKNINAVFTVENLGNVAFNNNITFDAAFVSLDGQNTTQVASLVPIHLNIGSL